MTTEGGLDVIRNAKQIAAAIERLKKAGLEVSVFIDPQLDQIERSSAVGAEMIEINTAAYAKAVPKGLKESDPGFQREIEKVRVAAHSADDLDLRVLAGHGLTYRNVRPISNIAEIIELNIGHNLIARATLVGMEQAVREMLKAMGS